MSDVTQSDIRDIKSQLRQIAEQQHHLIYRMTNMEKTIDDRIELNMRRRLDVTDKSRRETSSWTIGLVSFAIMVVFGLIQIGLRIWA